jgi:hypothetical protein
MKTLALAFASLLIATPVLAQTPSAQTRDADATALERYRTAERIGQDHLRTFDTLDYDVFSNQKWDRLKESHARDITVYWPDGHVAKGLDRHIEDLKAMFVYAPDIRIKQHPIRLGQGEWTTVVGLMEGTFTRPMTLADGRVIPPTGKAFKLPMATVGHWSADGTMSEEYLFWDNQSYLQQLGIAN